MWIYAFCLSIHCPVGIEHLHCFPPLAVVNVLLLKFLYKYLSDYLFLVLWGMFLVVEFQGHSVNSIELFQNCQTALPSSCAVLHSHYLCLRVQISLHSHWHLFSGHPGGREVIFQCDFALHFPSDQKYPVSFLVLIGHFVFGKTCSSPLLILKLDYLSFLLLSCRNSLY